MSASDWEDGFASSPPPESQTLPPARPRVRQRVRTADLAPVSPPPPPPPPPAPAALPEEPEEPQHQSERGSYEVGYKKPPRRTRFKPGQSGNPKGRPKGAKGIKTMVREAMTQKVQVRTATGVVRMSRMEAAIHKTHELAMKGNIRALAEIFKMYAAAVPEQDPPAQAEAASSEDLSAADLAILEALRRSFDNDEDEQS